MAATLFAALAAGLDKGMAGMVQFRGDQARAEGSNVGAVGRVDEGSVIQMRLISKLGGSVNLNGLDDHTVRDLPLVQAGAYVLTNLGPHILIVNQGAHHARWQGHSLFWQNGTLPLDHP